MKQKIVALHAFWMGGVCSVMFCQSAMGAGFGIRAQSAASVGTAYSTDGTGTSDPSGIFANPAVMSTFKGQNFSVGVGHIQDSIKFTDGKRSLPGTGGIDAGETDNTASGIAKPTSIPLLFGVHQVNDQFNVGWSITAPWGTSTTYKDNWIGRYNGTSTNLTVINGDLGFSYKLNDAISFGAGLQAQQAKGKISAAANGGALAVQAASAQFKNALVSLAKNDPTAFNGLTGIAAQMKTRFQTLVAGGTAQSAAATQAGQEAFAKYEGKNDIIAEYKGNDMAYGYNLGILYTPIPEFKLGLSYRSKVTHADKGNITFSPTSDLAAAVMAADAATGTNTLANSSADMKLTLPEVIILGVTYNLNPDISLFGNITNTRWSSVDALDVKYAGDSKDIVAKLDWKNVIASSIGAAYQLNSNLVLRTGVGMDKTPTTDTYRSPRTPDSDRTIVSLGAGYKGENWQVDAGWAHFMMKNPKLDLDETSYPEAAGRGNLTGTYKVNIDVLTAQYSMNI